jgi:hypothetical protein
MGKAINEIDSYSGSVSDTTLIPVSDSDTLKASTALKLWTYIKSKADTVYSTFSGAYADLTGKPTLGTAAALNHGTAAGNLVRLDATTAKLPAVDGSLLTGLPTPDLASQGPIGGTTPDAVTGTTVKAAVGGKVEVYNLDTDASNYERGFMKWASNVLRIGTEKLGTGTGRNLYLDTYDSITFWNTQYGYSMGFISGGNWNVGPIIPMSADSIVLGGNGSNGGAGWKTLAIASGTTATVGAVTMDKSAGRINVASGSTSVTVTNNRVSAASHVFASVTTNDATALIKSIVPTSGSFTVNLVAPTAQIELDFFVVQFGA